MGADHLNTHCRARPCEWPQPYDPDFSLSMSHLFGICNKEVWIQKNLGMVGNLKWVPKLLCGIYLTGLTWKDKNLGRKVEVKYILVKYHFEIVIVLSFVSLRTNNDDKYFIRWHEFLCEVVIRHVLSVLLFFDAVHFLQSYSMLWKSAD